MTQRFDEEPLDRTAGFPEIVDDADPADHDVPEPQEPALPGEDYLAAETKGTTVDEQIEGETLDEKLDRELPELVEDPLRPRAVDERLDEPDDLVEGVLVEPDEGAHEDREKDMVASARGRYGDASPEEQAMHIEPGT